MIQTLKDLPSVKFAISKMLRVGARQLLWALLGISLLGPCMMFAEAESEIVHNTRSPHGTFRVQQERTWEKGKNVPGVGTITAWIISARESAERVRLDVPYDDASGRFFFISPDEQWICAVVRYNTRQWDVMLYQHKADLQFHLVTTAEDPKWNFDPQDEDVRQKNEKGEPLDFSWRRYWFCGWSADSARLLVAEEMHGDDSKKPVSYFRYFYFNSRRGTLEHTKYILMLNRLVEGDALSQYIVPEFAEPLDPLPSEDQIRSHYQTAESKLNKIYPVVVKREKEKAEKVRVQDYQQRWLKARDASAEIFAALGPKMQSSRRKLQYLADATENRARELEEYLENLDKQH